MRYLKTHKQIGKLLMFKPYPSCLPYLCRPEGVGSTSACESENTNFQWWLRCTGVPLEQPVSLSPTREGQLQGADIHPGPVQVGHVRDFALEMT